MFAYFFGSPADNNHNHPYRHPPASEVSRPKKKKRKNNNNSNKARQRKAREDMEIDTDVDVHAHTHSTIAPTVDVGVDPQLSEDEEEDELFTHSHAHTHEDTLSSSAEQGVRLGQIDALIALLAERHELAEVQRCIDWMWQRGLRYDLEEDVERELALKNYEREEEKEADNSSEAVTPVAEEDTLKNNEPVNDEPVVDLQEQPAPEETPVEVVLERLRIVGSYASVNLYDCLAALCSWMCLQKQKNTLPDCERLFFHSDVLTDILHVLFLRHGLWTETPEVREALHSLFRELLGARKSTQAIAALEGALQRVDGEVRPTDMEARALARALSLCLFSYWENAKETSPDALKDLFARFESVSHEVVPSKLLKDSREAQAVLLQQQTLRSLIPELLSNALSSSHRSTLSTDELVARQTQVLQATLRELLSSTTGSEDKKSEPEKPISHDHLLAAEAALLKKKIEDAQNHREQLLVQVRLVDLEMADLQRQMGAVSRKLAAAEHAQKSSLSSSSAAAPVVPALQHQLNGVLEQFSRDLFVVAKDEPTVSSEQTRVLRGLQSFLQDTALGIIYCADVVLAFRQKIQGFAAQRAVYESLHMQKVLTQMDKEESSLNEHIQTLLGFIDASVTNVVGALSFLSHDIAEPLQDSLSSQPLVGMFVRLRALESAVPELLRSHVWTEHAWRNAQTVEYNPQSSGDVSGEAKSAQTKTADKKRVNSKNPRDFKKKSDKKPSVDTLSAIADLEKRTASKK